MLEFKFEITFSRTSMQMCDTFTTGTFFDGIAIRALSSTHRLAISDRVRGCGRFLGRVSGADWTRSYPLLLPEELCFSPFPRSLLLLESSSQRILLLFGKFTNVFVPWIAKCGEPREGFKFLFVTVSSGLTMIKNGHHLESKLDVPAVMRGLLGTSAVPMLPAK